MNPSKTFFYKQLLSDVYGSSSLVFRDVQDANCKHTEARQEIAVATTTHQPDNLTI